MITLESIKNLNASKLCDAIFSATKDELSALMSQAYDKRYIEYDITYEKVHKLLSHYVNSALMEDHL